MDLTLSSLRVLREIADRGSFTAAAEALGYTQSAVSRQIAALERDAGAQLLQRRPDGARLTGAGVVLLRHGRTVLDALDAADRELHAAGDDAVPVRLGVYVSAGAALLPAVVHTVRRHHPGIDLRTREGTTPSLVRAVRTGTLDLAVVTSRPPHPPPDDELPRLAVRQLDENELLVAVPGRGPLGDRAEVTSAQLRDLDWIASPGTGGDPLLGVWPGTPRPRVAHVARDWLTKLRLVAAGAGATTIPPNLAPLVPVGVTVVRVSDAGPEHRRALRLVRLPDRADPAVEVVARAVRAAALRRPDPAG